ncbi:MAG TPA: hypothetical protein VGD08_10770 [Stellaceae bacterium]
MGSNPFGSEDSAERGPTRPGEHVASEPEERPESEPPIEERRFVEFFGLPAMILLFALAAVIKGIVDQQIGFTIVGAVVAAGIFAAIGLAMTIAKRQ